MITWNGIKFTLPDGMRDETVLTFVDKSDAPTVSVTVSQEKLSGGKPALLRYVTDQLAEIAKSAPGYAVTNQTERAAGGFPAIVVTAAVGGGKRVQHQLYVLVGDKVVVAAVTATSAEKARTLVDHIASTFGTTA